MFSVVDVDSFTREVLADENPVLLALFETGFDAEVQAEALAAVSRCFSSRLKVCLVDENCLEALKGRYVVMGTPTFLLFHKGRECERMLGQADVHILARFVRKALGWREELNCTEH